MLKISDLFVGRFGKSRACWHCSDITVVGYCRKSAQSSLFVRPNCGFLDQDCWKSLSNGQNFHFSVVHGDNFAIFGSVKVRYLNWIFCCVVMLLFCPKGRVTLNNLSFQLCWPFNWNLWAEGDKIQLHFLHWKHCILCKLRNYVVIFGNILGINEASGAILLRV